MTNLTDNLIYVSAPAVEIIETASEAIVSDERREDSRLSFYLEEKGFGIVDITRHIQQLIPYTSRVYYLYEKEGEMLQQLTKERFEEARGYIETINELFEITSSNKVINDGKVITRSHKEYMNDVDLNYVVLDTKEENYAESEEEFEKYKHLLENYIEKRDEIIESGEIEKDLLPIINNINVGFTKLGEHMYYYTFYDKRFGGGVIRSIHREIGRNLGELAENKTLTPPTLLQAGSERVKEFLEKLPTTRGSVTINTSRVLTVTKEEEETLITALQEEFQVSEDTLETITKKILVHMTEVYKQELPLPKELKENEDVAVHPDEVEVTRKSETEYIIKVSAKVKGKYDELSKHALLRSEEEELYKKSIAATILLIFRELEEVIGESRDYQSTIDRNRLINTLDLVGENPKKIITTAYASEPVKDKELQEVKECVISGVYGASGKCRLLFDFTEEDTTYGFIVKDYEEKVFPSETIRAKTLSSIYELSTAIIVSDHEEISTMFLAHLIEKGYPVDELVGVALSGEPRGLPFVVEGDIEEQLLDKMNSLGKETFVKKLASIVSILYGAIPGMIVIPHETQDLVTRECIELKTEIPEGSKELIEIPFLDFVKKAQNIEHANVLLRTGRREEKEIITSGYAASIYLEEGEVSPRTEVNEITSFEEEKLSRIQRHYMLPGEKEITTYIEGIGFERGFLTALEIHIRFYDAFYNLIGKEEEVLNLEVKSAHLTGLTHDELSKLITSYFDSLEGLLLLKRINIV